MNRFFRYHLDHVIFWTLTIGFHAYTSRGLIGVLGINHYFGEVLVRNSLLAVLIYGNLLLVFPLLGRKKIILGILLLVLSLCAYVIFKTWHVQTLYSSIPGKYPDLQEYSPKFELLSELYYNFSIAFFYVGFSAALHLSKQWYLQRELIRQIQLEKLNTELDYLKAQMNPHFLFNSLNTVFFQIDKQNSEARETLGKFSDMLRYQLYECNADTIPIEKEVSYLKNYVALQQLRKDEHYTIDFQTDSFLRGFNIPPLLLIPFIENAFKHVSNHSDKPNKIEILLKKHGEILELKTVNTTDVPETQAPGGIGLKNVQRRLELLYSDKHWLTFEKTNELFSVTLKFRIE